MDSAVEKLQRGIQRLAEAGDDRDNLGQALLSLHGALEDYCRAWLAGNTKLSSEQRTAVLDRQQVQWKGLLDLMQMYGDLSDRDRRTVLTMNSLRQRVAHGDGFGGTRRDVESYAAFVQRVMGFSKSRMPAPPPQDVPAPSIIRSSVSPAPTNGIQQPAVPDERRISSAPIRPAALIWLKQFWFGRGKPAVRWRSLFGALLAFFIAGVAYTLALSSLRWQMPLIIIGWGCLALTIVLLFLGTRALFKVILQLGIKRLLIRGGIIYIVAVLITGLLLSTGQPGIKHWVASAWGVVGFAASSVGGLLHGLVDAPNMIRFASSGERDPVLVPGVDWEGNVPPTPLAVGLIVASEAEDSYSAPFASPATPTPPQLDRSLQIGDQVHIVGTDGATLRIREAPSGVARIVARLREGSSVQITDGPKQADGYTWWKVKSASGDGWCAADFLAREE